MSYARFGWDGSDVYIFMSDLGLECCGCSLHRDGDSFPVFNSTQAMVDHLAEHRAAGDFVPEYVEDELWADDEENWVTYPRCDVEGCDDRVRVFHIGKKACTYIHAHDLGILFIEGSAFPKDDE